ncbi:MAG: L-lactate dehydrogenase [Actinobacteria bacterium]|nr:L-lactate dehydrogenase [Actinomycetota bacterium]
MNKRDTTAKVSIIGCGNVGMRYAYAMLIKKMVRELVLIDIDMNRVEGEVMDLNHSVPFAGPVNIIAGNYDDIADSDLVVVTAGKSRKPGQSRLDLMKENIDIYRKIIPDINKNSPDSVMLVVSNPVDIMAYAAYKLSSRPHNMIIGSGTTLDTARLKSQMALNCEVNASDIQTYILGEHGDSEFALWSSSSIGGMLFKDYCPFCRKNKICDFKTDIKENIFKKVKQSGSEIIIKKGETSYGIGLSLARISEAILDNQNSILPVSTLVEDYLDVNDLYISLPCVINSEGVKKIIRPVFDEDEEKQFKESAGIIRQHLDKLDI